MNSEDYVALEALTGSHGWTGRGTFSRRHTFAILYTIVAAAGLSFLADRMPVLMHDPEPQFRQDPQELLQPQNLLAGVNPATPLTDLLGGTAEQERQFSGSSLDDVRKPETPVSGSSLDAVKPSAVTGQVGSLPQAAAAAASPAAVQPPAAPVSDYAALPYSPSALPDQIDGQAVSLGHEQLDNYDDNLTEAELADSDHDLAPKVITGEADADDHQMKWYTEVVQKNDTISAMFADLNIPPASYIAILSHKDLAEEVSSLKIGQSLSFLIDERNVLQAFVKPLSDGSQLRFYRVSGAAEKYSYVKEPAGTHLRDDDAITASLTAGTPPAAAAVQPAAAVRPQPAAQPVHEAAPQVTAAAEKKPAPLPATQTRGRLVVVKFEKGSVFSTAANAAGISYKEINQILKMFKGRIQFSRNIHPGDVMRVLYSQPKGQGKITAVEFSLGRKNKISSFLNPEDGKYYDEKGFNSGKTAFRRFPLNGKIVVSSPFNPNRRHPVLGYVRPHNGTDFAARIGTPVYAPADGVVDKAGYSRGGGYFVVIRHRGNVSTVYMHLSKIQVKQGQQVKLGSVIAKTGNTGLSTGPHLHYELRINGRPVNALRVNPSNTIDAEVNAKQRKRFASNVQQYKKDLYSNKLMTAMR